MYLFIYGPARLGSARLQVIVIAYNTYHIPPRSLVEPFLGIQLCEKLSSCLQTCTEIWCGIFRTNSGILRVHDCWFVDKCCWSSLVVSSCFDTTFVFIAGTYYAESKGCWFVPNICVTYLLINMSVLYHILLSISNIWHQCSRKTKDPTHVKNYNLWFGSVTQSRYISNPA